MTTHSWPQARAIAASLRGPLAALEVPLAEAVGSVLAVDLIARTDLPPFAAAAMDGWAVSGIGPWEVVGSLPAGATEPFLDDGTALSIATGAAVPAGTTGVLRTEHGSTEPTRSGQRLSVADGGGQPSNRPGHLHPGTDVRPRGQECRRGDLLLAKGVRLAPAAVGLAAAAGHDTILVVPPPSVALLILGDELLTRGEPHGGKVRDALGPALPGWIADLGGRCHPPVHVPDTKQDLQAALLDVAADVIVTTGSTARGPVDHLHDILDEADADWVVDGVAVRPGHPMLLAALPDGPVVVGLPGNPLAAMSGLLTLGAPVLARLAGTTERPHPYATAVLAHVAVGHPIDTRLVPVEVTPPGAGPARVTVLRHIGPAMLRSIALADALAVLPPGGCPAGGTVKLIRLP